MESCQPELDKWVHASSVVNSVGSALAAFGTVQEEEEDLTAAFDQLVNAVLEWYVFKGPSPKFSETVERYFAEWMEKQKKEATRCAQAAIDRSVAYLSKQ
eukprot:944909-Lingulodinium_polyedra.AAC.1